MTQDMLNQPITGTVEMYRSYGGWYITIKHLPAWVINDLNDDLDHGHRIVRDGTGTGYIVFHSHDQARWEKDHTSTETVQ